MKYIFVIQGEGRGHLTQALSLQTMLKRHGHEVVEMLVGKSNHRELPAFFVQKAEAPITTFASPNFLPTAANKRNALGRSVAYNLTCLPQFVKSMLLLRRHIKDSEADVVINFYELLTGLLYGCTMPGVPCYCIGHQYLFLHKDFRFPRINRGNLFLLKWFTWMTSLRCERRLALSFHDMPVDRRRRIFVVPPLLRPEVLTSSAEAGNYILGYMVNSGFAADVEHYHASHPGVNLHFFWDRKGAADVTPIDETLTYHRINDRSFLQYMRGCRAYATTAGFESVCEAIYLGKPVLMVPAHIEQDCNAWDAMQLGAGIVGRDFNLDALQRFCVDYKRIEAFPRWVCNAEFRILPLLLPDTAPTDAEGWFSLSSWSRILGGTI